MKKKKNDTLYMRHTLNSVNYDIGTCNKVNIKYGLNTTPIFRNVK